MCILCWVSIPVGTSSKTLNFVILFPTLLVFVTYAIKPVNYEALHKVFYEFINKGTAFETVDEIQR